MLEQIADAFVPILCLLITAGGGYLVALLRRQTQQIEEELDNETASKYIDLATDAVEQAVTYTAQTFVDALKAEGAFTKEKQLEALQAQLRQTLGTKTRLERQMDGLDISDSYYDRKISDLQRRYDEQYGRIDEIEVQIDDVQSQIRSIRQEKISGDNIYRLLLAFDQVYEAASEVERKEFMRAFIERIELFPEKQPDGNWIRKIIFNFPVPVNGTEVKELPLENETMVETIVLLQRETL